MIIFFTADCSNGFLSIKTHVLGTQNDLRHLFEKQGKKIKIIAGPPIMKDEIWAAIRTMKFGKATGSDQ